VDMKQAISDALFDPRTDDPDRWMSENGIVIHDFSDFVQWIRRAVSQEADAKGGVTELEIISLCTTTFQIGYEVARKKFNA